MFGLVVVDTQGMRGVAAVVCCSSLIDPISGVNRGEVCDPFLVLLTNSVSLAFLESGWYSNFGCDWKLVLCFLG